MLTPVGLTIAAAYTWTSAFFVARDFDSVTVRCDGTTTLCQSDQIVSIPTTVMAAGITGGKNKTYWIDLLNLEGGEQYQQPGLQPFDIRRLTMENGRGVWPRASSDNQVIVTEWHGLYTDVSDGGGSSRTADNPDVVVYFHLQLLAIALLPFLFVSWLELAWWWRDRRIGFFIGWLALADVAYFVVVVIEKTAVYFPALLALAGAGPALFAATVLIRLVRRGRAAARPLPVEPEDARPFGAGLQGSAWGSAQGSLQRFQPGSTSLAATSLSRRSGLRRLFARSGRTGR